MNELSKNISSLLIEHGYAIIPGFGGFVLHHVSSEITDSGRLLSAPASEIAFNEKLKVDDGLLVQSYMKNSNLSFSTAARKVKSVVGELEDELYGKGELTFPGIGCLKMSIRGNISFSATNDRLADTNLFGLQDLEIQLLADIKAAQPKVSVAGEHKVRKVSVWSYAQYAAACVVAIVLYFSSAVSIDNSSVHRYDNMASMLPSTSVMEINGKVSVEVVEDKDLPEPEVKTVSEPEIEAKPVAEVKKAETVAPVSSVKRYHIVIASLALEDDSEHAVNILKKEGYTGAFALRSDSRIRIVLKSFENFEEAVKESENIRETTKFKDAWVLTKRI